MNPGSGTEVTVNVTGNCLIKLKFLIKKYLELKVFLLLHRCYWWRNGVVKGAKSRLEVSQISAKLQILILS
jgi:hypothetical protein